MDITKLKLYLNISATTADTFLLQCLNSAIDYARDYTQRALFYNTFSEMHSRENFFDYKYHTDLYLQEYPIEKINKFEYYDEAEKMFKEINFTDYIINGQSKITIFQQIPFSTIYRINYNAGYKDLEIPADLQMAINKLAAKYYLDSQQGDKRQGINSRNFNSQGSEGFSFGDVLPEINSILDKYKRIAI